MLLSDTTQSSEMPSDSNYEMILNKVKCNLNLLVIRV